MQQSNFRLDNDFLRQILTLGAIATAFVVNVISNIFPLNGLSIGEISNTLFRNVLIIPANYAFAIWGLIYLGLFAFAVYQFLPNQKQDPDLRNIGYLLVIASLAQSIWVYLFLDRLFFLSVVAMLGILLPLIVAYLRLEIGKNPVSRIKKWCVHFPISIYLGWISVATIVNVACALYAQNWNGGGISAEVWTLILLIVAAVVTIAIAIQYQDGAYTGVTVWALVAVGVKNWDKATVRNLALVLAIALIVLIVTRVLLSRRSG
ncbi:tryptophan-rich sensory protein [Scytonema sp. UIC 10036]|uniref:tryptophan-rich sensory protein n=1 Tax=Scytonema sp. UIC 10036 TaxID=2304196 RepID=UPI0012DAA9AB|nr:tryptophan-rich sensory protein [Scytonema sp. UIC 10036]MUG95425.1 tryptophan-rich sensory protein [Scytonema sp. UIC 10036]